MLEAMGMTREDARGLGTGLFRIHWVMGGDSLASVGRNGDGVPWFAPCNWLNNELHKACRDWSKVAHIERIDPSGQEYRDSLPQNCECHLDRLDRFLALAQELDSVGVDPVFYILQMVVDGRIEREPGQIHAMMLRISDLKFEG